MTENEFDKTSHNTIATKCQNCGAILNFEPGTNHLKCQYCGAENEIKDTEAETEIIEELDYNSFINQSETSENLMQVTTVKCSSCGATHVLQPNISSDICPFCGNPIIVSGGSTMSVI